MRECNYSMYACSNYICKIVGVLPTVIASQRQMCELAISAKELVVCVTLHWSVNDTVAALDERRYIFDKYCIFRINTSCTCKLLSVQPSGETDPVYLSPSLLSTVTMVIGAILFYCEVSRKRHRLLVHTQCPCHSAVTNSGCLNRTAQSLS